MYRGTLFSGREIAIKRLDRHGLQVHMHYAALQHQLTYTLPNKVLAFVAIPQLVPATCRHTPHDAVMLISLPELYQPTHFLPFLEAGPAATETFFASTPLRMTIVPSLQRI